MKKLLTNIIIWVLKRNTEIKDNIISNICEDIKNNKIEEIDLKNEERIINFKNVKAGDVIISKTKDWHGKIDISHYFRPYFIVGRTEDRLYGLYCTSSDKANNDINFFHFFNKSDIKKEGRVSHVDCKKICVLDINHFKDKAFTTDILTRRKILEKLIQVTDGYESYVDFSYFGFNPGVNSVVKYNGNFYYLYDKLENNKFNAALLKESGRIDKGIIIFNKGYVLDKTKKEVIDKEDIEYVIYEKTHDFKKSIHKLKTDVISPKIDTEKNIIEVTEKETLETNDSYNEEKYKFGDVLSLRNSRNKIIYLTTFNKQIYYITDEQLELYTGMRFAHESEINGFYRKLSDKEFSRLINVLNKPLNSDKIKFVPNDVKDDIKDNISRKQLK